MTTDHEGAQVIAPGEVDALLDRVEPGREFPALLRWLRGRRKKSPETPDLSPTTMTPESDDLSISDIVPQDAGPLNPKLSAIESKVDHVVSLLSQPHPDEVTARIESLEGSLQQLSTNLGVWGGELAGAKKAIKRWSLSLLAGTALATVLIAILLVVIRQPVLPPAIVVTAVPPTVVVTVVPPTVVVTVAPLAPLPSLSPTAEKTAEPTQEETTTPKTQEGTPEATPSTTALPVQVSITGPLTITLGTVATFTATVDLTAALPITYVWQSSGEFAGTTVSGAGGTGVVGQAVMTHTAGLTDTMTFTWNTTGTQAITVTATNGKGKTSSVLHVTVTRYIFGATIKQRSCAGHSNTICFWDNAEDAAQVVSAKVKAGNYLLQGELVAIVGQNEGGTAYLISIGGERWVGADKAAPRWVNANHVNLPLGSKPEYLPEVE